MEGGLDGRQEQPRRAARAARGQSRTGAGRGAAGAVLQAVTHIPGAINLSHDEVDARALELLPDKDAEIVVYCASATCQNSGMAANRLASLGYTNVRDYHEGKKIGPKDGVQALYCIVRYAIAD